MAIFTPGLVGQAPFSSEHLAYTILGQTACSLCFPLLPFASRCFPFLPIASHCFPLLPFASLCFPLLPIASLCFPLLPLLSFASLCFPLLPFASLCFPLLSFAFHCFPLLLPLLPIASHCFPLLLIASHCFTGPTGSHGKPREATGSHGKQREATGSNGKPREAMGSHGKQREATGSNGKPREATGSHGKQQEATGSNKKPREATGSHGKPQLFGRPSRHQFLERGKNPYIVSIPPDVLREQLLHVQNSSLGRGPQDELNLNPSRQEMMPRRPNIGLDSRSICQGGSRFAKCQPCTSYREDRGPRTNGFKIAQDDPKMACDGLTWPQDGPTEGPGLAQGRPRMAQDTPKMGLRWSKLCPT
jgi:hypothetical protein